MATMEYLLCVPTVCQAETLSALSFIQPFQADSLVLILQTSKQIWRWGHLLRARRKYEPGLYESCGAFAGFFQAPPGPGMGRGLLS